MLHFLRLVFVVLLVLLQLVAPLIHAHKNEQFSVGSSFHLPEFEQVNALLDNGSNMIAPSLHEGEMVTMSVGVKETQRCFLSDDDLHTAIVLSFLLLFAIFEKAQLPFSVQIKPIRQVRLFNLAFPRAPPFFTL
ncbi:MAG: hypothetical protein PHD53_05430 [Methylococcales bacterium]|nr:hypothetical protein [Methylococcales bacterium]